MLSKLVLVHAVWGAVSVVKLLPQTLYVCFAEAFSGERMDSFFKDRISHRVAASTAEVNEKVVHGVTVGERRLYSILKLNDELVRGVECLEGVSPVVDV